jgi:hypothetical protein
MADILGTRFAFFRGHVVQLLTHFHAGFTKFVDANGTKYQCQYCLGRKIKYVSDHVALPSHIEAVRRYFSMVETLAPREVRVDNYLAGNVALHMVSSITYSIPPPTPCDSFLICLPQLVITRRLWIMIILETWN